MYKKKQLRIRKDKINISLEVLCSYHLLLHFQDKDFHTNVLLIGS